ncbi:nitrogen fixation protein NifQ [Paraburkholderia acidisoli]|uniref:Nitrogen fixation protein NifQ n=1 Tax=Paraburkholderia acidisoli TaxID=2571748 RepID=A0A7Z2JFT8_9BURK|nr:nitrogen fixation protein NifQ [Paraburkholderia acidisoli]QGZ63802.1 nitrogen fixation protein NifQ [Paraburkholderia acidisoli]
MNAETPDFDAQALARSEALSGAPSQPRSEDAWLFARLVAAREVRGELALLGLTQAELEALAARHFAGAIPAMGVEVPQAMVLADTPHAHFAAAMRDFLLGFAAPPVDPGDARCLASIIANACLRPDHLWRDLGLRGRDDVTRMLTRFFPEIVTRNAEGLRWKKLLAREFALARGETPGPAPGCPGCEDFGFCFPHEHTLQR